MKLKKRPVVEDEDESSSSDADEQPSSDWVLRDPDDMKKSAEQAKALSGSRPPELWINDGETKTLWFRDPDPIGSIEVYTIRYSAKKFRTFTRPAPGKPDLFASKLGLTPTRKYIFEVVDIDGFTDKKGKTQRNVARFYVVGTRVYEQIMSLSNLLEGTPLNQVIVKIRRQGSSTKTTYTFMPVTKRPSEATTSVKRIKGQFSQYYAPLPLDAQRAIAESAPQGYDDRD